MTMKPGYLEYIVKSITENLDSRQVRLRYEYMRQLSEDGIIAIVFFIMTIQFRLLE